MKVAIIGGSLVGLSAASKLHHLGAEVTLFEEKDLGYHEKTLARLFPELPLYQERDREVTSLIEDLPVRVRPLEVKRISKYFLSPSETIEGRSRLHDLFKVVYSVNPQNEVKRRRAENPDLFKDIPDHIQDSLTKSVEGHENFDIIIDASAGFRDPLPLGSSEGEALNEARFKDHIFYGFSSLENSELIKENKSLLVVGSGQTAALVTLLLKDWMKENKLFLVTTEATPFQMLQGELKGKVEKLLLEHEEEWGKKKRNYEEELRKWRDLEDYMKAKVSPPSFPEKNLEVISSANIIAVDQLVDQPGLFVTAEGAPFRENNVLGDKLKTLAVDSILGTTGYRGAKSRHFGIVENEPGFYNINLNDDYSTEDIARELDLIVENILTYFSKA